MAEEEMNETPPASASDDKEETLVSVIEIHDSSNECEEEARPRQQMEEKSFISGLHSYMKVRGTPIERIPHLGFKQINLWRIYKAVEKLGGYDSVTTRRLWKRVYDDLGGSPGSTSAATCTRKHYERLVLPYERHIKGEEDKPLPPTKPRKPYKRNLDGKVDKADVKNKRSHLNINADSELIIQTNELVLHPRSSMWAAPSDKLQPDSAKPNSDISLYDLSHVLSAPRANSWTAQVPPVTGAGMSPLEKKKRTAQASLSLPQGEENQRLSVILCSQSPVQASPVQTSSDGSPQPSSSSSSRSTSPLSVSSEESSVNHQEKPSPSLDVQQNHCSVKSKSTEDRVSQLSEETARQKTEFSSQVMAEDFTKGRIKNTSWRPLYKGTHSSSFPPKYDLAPASTSSFTKVVPKTVQPLRPAPIRLGYKMHQTRHLQEEPLTCVKKLNSPGQRIYQTEKWDNSRSRLSKTPVSQHGLIHNLPMTCMVPSYEKPGRDTRHQPQFYPAFLPNRMRLPHAQIVYRQVPVTPNHPVVIGSAGYPYSYPMSLHGYSLPNGMPIYPHKL